MTGNISAQNLEIDTNPSMNPNTNPTTKTNKNTTNLPPTLPSLPPSVRSSQPSNNNPNGQNVLLRKSLNSVYKTASNIHEPSNTSICLNKNMPNLFSHQAGLHSQTKINRLNSHSNLDNLTDNQFLESSRMSIGAWFDDTYGTLYKKYMKNDKYQHIKEFDDNMMVADESVSEMQKIEEEEVLTTPADETAKSPDTKVKTAQSVSYDV